MKSVLCDIANVGLALSSVAVTDTEYCVSEDNPVMVADRGLLRFGVMIEPEALAELPSFFI